MSRGARCPRCGGAAPLGPRPCARLPLRPSLCWSVAGRAISLSEALGIRGPEARRRPCRRPGLRGAASRQVEARAPGWARAARWSPGRNGTSCRRVPSHPPGRDNSQQPVPRDRAGETRALSAAQWGRGRARRVHLRRDRHRDEPLGKPPGGSASAPGPSGCLLSGWFRARESPSQHGRRRLLCL